MKLLGLILFMVAFKFGSSQVATLMSDTTQKREKIIAIQPPRVVSRKIYDITGKELESIEGKGLFFIQTLYSDDTLRTVKRIEK